VPPIRVRLPPTLHKEQIVAKKRGREEREENELTNLDWGKIHAKAWKEPEFRTLLETNPTGAIREYERIENERREKEGEPRLYFKVLLKLAPAPDPKEIPECFWEDINPFPPSCC
jgi:hypothetical protein